LLKVCRGHRCREFLLILEICDLQVHWYNVRDIDDHELSSEDWQELTSHKKRRPRKTIVKRSSMRKIYKNAEGIWVQILVAESTTKTVTHKVLHMQLSFGKDRESVHGRGQDDYEDETQ
jgi:hypothetical protein